MSETSVRRKTLTSRLLTAMGLAAGLPLLLLVAAVILVSYRASNEQTYATVEQTSLRFAAQFESRLNEKLGLLRGLIAVQSFDDPREAGRLRSFDPDLRMLWTHREGQSFDGETPAQKELYRQVKERGTDVLSAPDFALNQAGLGVPVFEHGAFTGMVAVFFSLEYFQSVVNQVRLFSTGYTFLVSHEGYRMAHPVTRLIGVRMGNDVTPEVAADILQKIEAGRAFWYEKRAALTGKWSRQYFSPMTVGKAARPWIVGVVVPVDEATSNLDSLFLVLITGSALTLLLVAAAAWRTTRMIVLPLRDLAQSAETIAAGNLDARVAVKANDEFSTVGAAFNRMTDRLVTTLRDQEKLVKERTASLEQAHGKIVASEKMAVLGQLTATIAHEVNTPLGAIRSSATFLTQALAGRLENMAQAVKMITSEDMHLYQALVRQRSTDLRHSDGGADRKRRRELTARLKAAGVASPEIAADDVVFLVPKEGEEQLFAAVLEGRSNTIRMAAQAAAMAQSGAIILEAADRAASTVSALVNYARLSDVGWEDGIDPARELETILAIYYGPSRKGVEIVKDFETGVLLTGDRDKLNQVWVNLINNALQAMSFKGRLTLGIRRVGTATQVTVANDGPSIAPELREKIFQPFFTTKKTGEGTGLGLDICRRIVEAHNGTLSLSEEGRLTVFTVTLPARSPL